MKKLIIALAVFVLAGCANKPYEQTTNVIEPKLTTKKADSTQIRIHRVSQISGSGLGEGCPLVVSVDNTEAAGLQQNQYVDLFLDKGNHTVKVRFSCALTGWSKSLDIVADGSYQEYETETGMAGQYRMWRTK
ncbi:hypothetical protein ACS78O_21580 [Yersinia enterocolitica]|uniref:hypothetical protein n=1 Tax=Yersinia enterocolitica TaxID=630 RepID=UPI003CFFE74C|nr:hypothetical protein [Yersinia enterocolitica]